MIVDLFPALMGAVAAFAAHLFFDAGPVPKDDPAETGGSEADPLGHG